MWLLVQQDSGAVFLYACLCGAVIGAIYDVFRILRVIWYGGRIKHFFEDFLFCLIAAIVFTVFSYNAAMGSVRLFSAIGVAFGFFAYRFSLGLLSVPLAKRLRKMIALPLGRFKVATLKRKAYIVGRFFTFRCTRHAKSLSFEGFKV